MGTVLLTSFGAFRALFWQGAASLVVLLSLSWLLIPQFGVAGALAAMVAVELLELATNHAYLLPMVKRKYLETPHA
jgi:O-antigen/teichoic acid export membrane protein